MGNLSWSLWPVYVKLRLNWYFDLVESRHSFMTGLNPFAPGDFAEKRILKLVEWFSGHCPQTGLQVVHFMAF